MQQSPCDVLELNGEQPSPCDVPELNGEQQSLYDALGLNGRQSPHGVQAPIEVRSALGDAQQWQCDAILVPHGVRQW